MDLSEVKTGDVIFFKKEPWYRSLASYLIVFITKSEFVHCGICLVDNDLGGICVIESQFGLCRNIVPIRKFHGREVVICSPLIPYNTAKNIAIMSDIYFIKYSLLDLFLVGVRTLMHRLGINVKFRDFEGEICSEFVAKVNEISPSVISPSELFEIFKMRNAIKMTGKL